ncbi:hypothetical protein ACFLQR_04090, partial [Verrucomicrobiota bacterium]
QKKKNFTLTEGEETVDGIQLVSVDYDSEEATLSRGTETSVFTLNPKKSAANEAKAKKTAPGRTRMPLRPFFSNLKKKKVSPVEADGSTTPFRGKTIESFLKEHPEAALQHPSPIQPPDPTAPTKGMGETIERFLRENPDAARQFSPIQPPDSTVGTKGRGATIERFLRENSGELQQIQPPTPIPFPYVEQPVETYDE